MYTNRRPLRGIAQMPAFGQSETVNGSPKLLEADIPSEFAGLPLRSIGPESEPREANET